MPIPSQTGIPYNKLATKSMVMDMRHKCNYKIRKNKYQGQSPVHSHGASLFKTPYTRLSLVSHRLPSLVI